MSIGFQEILLIVVVFVLLFGAKRIPELARAIGRASFEFKKAKDDLRKETDSIVAESEKNAAAKDASESASTETKKDA